jgi:ATP-dependent Clp protease ATP-binding subunit ClpX
MIPEFVGRLPVVSVLSAMTEEDLMRVLTEPQNSITKQYEKLMMLDGARLVIDEDAKREMARIAAARGTGARGLRAVLEETMLDVMFNVTPHSTVNVTKKMITEACNEEGKAA